MCSRAALFVLILTVPGCVIKYGEVPQPVIGGGVEGADLSGLERDLLELREVAAEQDVDQRDRIDAALELIRLAETGQLSEVGLNDYLSRVVEIERRGQGGAIAALPRPSVEEEPLGGGALVTAPIVEEVLELGDPEVEDLEEEGADGEADGEAAGASEDTEAGADPADREDAVARAREALAAEDYAAALKALEAFKDAPEVEDVWWEAANGWVHSERNRAGERYLEARDLPAGKERAAAIQEVLDILEGLQEDYPGNEYEDAIDRNIGLVKRALEEAKE